MSRSVGFHTAPAKKPGEVLSTLTRISADEFEAGNGIPPMPGELAAEA